MKYHKGQKVIILPSAREIAIGNCSINQTGTITVVYNTPKFLICDYTVEMFCTKHNYPRTHKWGVRECDIKLAVVKGQQLLLWDNVDEIN